MLLDIFYSMVYTLTPYLLDCISSSVSLMKRAQKPLQKEKKKKKKKKREQNQKCPSEVRGNDETQPIQVLYHIVPYSTRSD